VPLIYFLLVFDHARQELVESQEFTHPDEATEAYERVEREHRADPNLEVVLVGSDSIETVKLTHGNYFSGAVATAARREADLASKA
jgi:hypothetical protein